MIKNVRFAKSNNYCDSFFEYKIFLRWFNSIQMFVLYQKLSIQIWQKVKGANF